MGGSSGGLVQHDIMKILISTDTYKHQINGVANATSLLADELRNRGHQVKVLSLSDKRESYKNGDDYFISSVSSLIYPDMRISLKVNDVLIRELIEWHPDVVHIQTEFSARILAMAVVKSINAPIVMTFHTHYEQFVAPYIVGKKLLTKVASFFYHRTYRKTKVLVAPSYKAKDILENYHIHQPIYVIPNGIPFSDNPITPQEKARMLKKLRIPNNGKVLVSVSRISHEKNLDELIDFMPALLKREPQIRLLIVGGGPHLKKLQKKAAKMRLSGRVIFSGPVPHSEVDKYYQLGNIFVCASTFETQGLTYAEAMSNRLPLVCRSDKCLVNVIENGKNGYTYNNREEYIRYILKILDNPHLQRTMSDISKTRSVDFGKERFVNSMEALYQSVIEHSSSESDTSNSHEKDSIKK